MKDFFLRRCIANSIFIGTAYSVTTTVDAVEQDSAFRLSGFGTLGLTYNTSRDFDYIRDLLQTKGVGASRRIDAGVDSILGLQFSATANDDLEATAQIVTRRSYREFRPELSWLYIRYSPDDNLDLRAGRLGFDVYPLADSRNVGYSYLWVRPPVEYFGNLIISHIDGVDAVYKFNTDRTQTKLKFYSGQAQEQVLVDSPNSFLSLKGSKIFGGHVEFQSQHWLARVGLTNLSFHNELSALVPLINALNSAEINAINPSSTALAHDLSFKEKRIRYLSAGLAYDQGPLQAQLMYSRLKSETFSFSSNKSIFLTLGYRIKEWTPYFTLARTSPIDSLPFKSILPIGINPKFDEVNTALQRVSSNALSEQKNQSIGLRYNLSNNSNFKVQIDHLQNKQRALVREAKASWDGKSNIISFAFNFVFH